jgi:hypothetical protein
VTRRFSLPRLALAVAALGFFASLPACKQQSPAGSTTGLGAAIPVPPELTAALAAYRATGPKGWAFTQSTEGGGRNLVERFDPRVRGPARWTLLSKDGHAPNEEEQRTYRQESLGKNSGDTASSVRDQIDLATCALVASDERTATYHFALHPAAKADTAAVHMRAAFTLDRPSGAIVRVELFSFEPFSPVLTLKIDEARTIMSYTVPSGGQPSQLKEITMKLRGRRLWMRSFTEDMTMRYSDQVNAGVGEPAPVDTGTTPGAAVPQS